MSCSRASYKGDHNFYCELGGDCLMFSPEWSLCKKNDKSLAEMEYKQATYSCDCGQYICHEDGSICPYSTPDPDCCNASLRDADRSVIEGDGKLLNGHGEYVMRFARNHGLTLAEAHAHPMVKAHLVAFNHIQEVEQKIHHRMGDIMKGGFLEYGG